MNTTKILGEAVGIQSQGAVDHTESQTKVGLTSAIIIGQFKRGRVDRPMVIHNGNIRGQLGYEPNNPYYMAVQDCLDTGVPSVQVLRVGGIDNGNIPIIGCEGATNSFKFLEVSKIGTNPPAESASIIIDGVQLADDDPLPEWLQIIFLEDETYPLPIPTGYEVAVGLRQFINLGTENHRFEFIHDPDWGLGLVYDNPTVIEFKDVVGQDTGVCLAPFDEDLDLYTPAILALNPKAYYLMSEESGNVVTDLSPSGFDGEIRHTENITYRQEIIRKGSAGALGFNTGTNGSSGTAECFVSDATAGDFFRKLAGNGKSCTIAFWCKPVSSKQYTYLAAYMLNSTMGYNNYRFIAYNGDKLLAQSPNNDNQVASTNSFTEMINQSNFIVWRKDAVAQTYTLTVNGVSKTVSGEASPEAAGQGFYFPMSDGYSSYGLRGYMSDMSVFDYALSDAQITDLYNKGKLA